MKLFIGADHGGFAMKSKIIEWLKQLGHDVTDCGDTIFDPRDDFPDFAFPVADNVSATPDSRGIVLCRSGGGVTIAANKVRGIRAVTAVSPVDIAHNRNHDDVNVVAISADYTNENEAKILIKTFLDTPFDGGERFVRRLNKIKAREDAWSK